MASDKKPGFFEETEEMVEKYVQDRMLLFKLQATEKAANLVALMVSGIVIGMIGFFILMFLSIMAGYYFAELTGSLFYGFGIITLVYIVLLIILVLLRKKILHNFVANTVVRIIFDKQTDEDEPNSTHNVPDQAGPDTYQQP
ncbi:phage holin family protein [Parasegetibacter sp. NRK P23]|uniref:phage holin family protein n=1 Tax=Parasegetibacter sp. NRK P23 TaxID=2942999 RepID=UPI00204333F5|nr:phage holin family protein [Parasegetibacter sp. NRK P23]MCM5527483.1 phage holin family protein [Parasegetibacter sp. NRK P23]